MKKTICIVLAIFLLCLNLLGCSQNSANTTPTDNTPTRISGEQALQIGKQAAVNYFCAKEYVNQISIVYSKEQVTLNETEEEWKIYLTGHYYPIDTFGHYKDSEDFSFSAYVDYNGKITYSNGSTY